MGRRGFFVSIDHPALGTLVSDRSALQGRHRRGAWRGAPLLGADNEYVFGGLLGLSESEIDSYREKGIIA